MVKKVVKKDSKELKIDNGLVAYILGILAIVQSFLVPFLSGVVLGIIGLRFSKKEKTPLAEKAKKLNMIGIIISAIISLFILVLQVIRAMRVINSGLI